MVALKQKADFPLVFVDSLLSESPRSAMAENGAVGLSPLPDANDFLKIVSVQPAGMPVSVFQMFTADPLRHF